MGKLSLSAALTAPAAVSGLFLNQKVLNLGKSLSVGGPIGSPLWDVMRVGTDLEAVKAEYKATLASGELKADGFTPTACTPDRNLKTRDLQGKSTSYEGPISVIKYEDVVPKTEQKPMTHEVCYEFCRRFELVKFFGITNGSKCYCEPMFVVATAGSKGGCKVPCEGNPGQMCGGPDFSSIFEMHDCPPKEKFSSDAVLSFTALKGDVASMGTAAKDCIDTLVKSGSKLVNSQEQKGNTIVQKHQKAMTLSYQTILADMNALSFESAKVSAKLETALGEYSGLGDATNAAELEAKMEEVEMASDAAAAALPQITGVYEQCHPNITSDGTAMSFYTTISETASAHSCDGKIISPTVQVSSGEECAKLCSETTAPTMCVGFQLYSGLEGADKVCLMFSEIAGVALYSKADCPSEASMDGKCYVPKVDIAAHELAVKDETVALDYCFPE